MLQNIIRNTLIGGSLAVGLAGCFGQANDSNNRMDIGVDMRRSVNPSVNLPAIDLPRPDVYGTVDSEHSTDNYSDLGNSNYNDSGVARDSSDNSMADIGVGQDLTPATLDSFVQADFGNDLGRQDSGKEDLMQAIDEGVSYGDIGVDAQGDLANNDYGINDIGAEVASSDSGSNYDGSDLDNSDKFCLYLNENGERLPFGTDVTFITELSDYNGIETQDGRFKNYCADNNVVIPVCGTVEDNFISGNNIDLFNFTDNCKYGCNSIDGTCCEPISESYVCVGKDLVTKIETTCGSELKPDYTKITCPVDCQDGTCITSGDECEGDRFTVCEKDVELTSYFCVNGNIGNTWSGMSSSCHEFARCDVGTCKDPECLEGTIEKIECDFEGPCKGYQTRECDSSGRWGNWTGCDLESLEFSGGWLDGQAIGEKFLAVTHARESEDLVSDIMSVYLYKTNDLSLVRIFELEAEGADVRNISISGDNALISHFLGNTFINLESGETINFDHLNDTYSSSSRSGNSYKSQCLDLDGTKAYCFTQGSSKIRIRDVATSTDEFIDFEALTGQKVNFDSDANFQVRKFSEMIYLAGSFSRDINGTYLVSEQTLFIYDQENNTLKVIDEQVGCHNYPSQYGGSRVVFQRPVSVNEDGSCTHSPNINREIFMYDLTEDSVVNLSQFSGVSCNFGDGGDISGLYGNLLVCPTIIDRGESRYRPVINIVDINNFDTGIISDNGKHPRSMIYGKNILLGSDDICRLKDEWRND